MRFYRNGGDLLKVAYGASSRIQQILLSGQVTLNSFQIGSDSPRTTQVTVIDAATNAVLFDESASIGRSTTFSGPWTSSVGIALQLGPDLFNPGVDNIDFTIPGTLAGATTGGSTDATSEPTDASTEATTTTTVTTSTGSTISEASSTDSTTTQSTESSTTTMSMTTVPDGQELTVLIFEGDNCNGGQTCSSGASIDQSYGDTDFQDVIYTTGLDATTAGTIAAEGQGFQYWRSGYGSLLGVAWGEPDGSAMQQIHIRGRITLLSFQLAAFYSGRSCSIRVIDAATSALLFESLDQPISKEGAETFSGPWASDEGIVLQLGPNLYDIGVDNIAFFTDISSGTLAPLPMTTGEIATTSTTAAPTTSTTATTTASFTNPPDYSSVLLSFDGAICDGEECSNGDAIDQSYGDQMDSAGNRYVDVRYSAGLDASTAGVIAPVGRAFEFWGSGYADLQNVAYGSSSSTMQQIYLRGDVQLNRFELGGFSTRTCRVIVLDAFDGSVLFQQDEADISSSTATSFSGPWSGQNATGIVIQLGPDLYNTAIDNIDFAYRSTTPLPTTEAPSTTTPPMTEDPGPQPPLVARTPTYIDRTSTGNLFSGFTIFTTPGNVIACFVNIESQVFSTLLQVSVDDERVPLTTFESYGGFQGATHTMISFFFKGRESADRARIFVNAGKGAAYCIELEGATGLDAFDSSGTRLAIVQQNLRLELNCVATSILTATFSVDNRDVSLMSGQRLFTNGFDQVGGISMQRVFNESARLSVVSYSPSAQFAVAALAFGSCPTTAESCEDASCSCSGRFCQSSEPLSTTALAVSPDSAILGPELSLNGTTTASLPGNVRSALIQTHGGAGDLQLAGRLVISATTAATPIGVELPIAQSNGASAVVGTFSSIVVAQNNPCETLAASPVYTATTAGVLLSLTLTPNAPGCGNGPLPTTTTPLVPTCATSPLPCVNGLCRNTATGVTCGPCPVSSEGMTFAGQLCDRPVCGINNCGGAIRGSCNVLVGSQFPTCTCAAGWAGSDCTEPLCALPCANGGVCTESNMCNCAEAWQGESCVIELAANTCPLSCGAGNCTGTACLCPLGHSGRECQFLSCPASCSWNGQCVAAADTSQPPVCLCAPGWSGTDCATEECVPQTCVNGGTCVVSSNNSLACLCSSGYAGYQCQIDLSLEGEASTAPLTSRGLSAGAIAGIVIGAVVAGILIALLIIFFFRYRRKKQTEAAAVQIAARNNLAAKSSADSSASSLQKDYTESFIPLEDLTVDNHAGNR